MQFGNVLYFLVWAALIFFMMRYGCGAHVMGHAHPGHHGSDPSTPPYKAVDPVCGMILATQSAKSAMYAGNAYYFCSANYRDKFEAAPTTYAKSSSAHEGHHHGC